MTSKRKTPKPKTPRAKAAAKSKTKKPVVPRKSTARSPKKPTTKPRAARKSTTKKSPAKTRTRRDLTTFLGALANLLESRGLKVPPKMMKAPPEAYADQPAVVVELLSNLSDVDLVAQSQRIAGFAERKLQRARASWNTSPLIVELRKRRLREPVPPDKIVGAAISFRKPLHEWTDDEILAAADEWSRRGSD